MSLFFSAGVSGTQNNTSSQEEDDVQSQKNIDTIANSNTTQNSTTQNSGSVNTAQVIGSSGTAASQNTTTVGPSSSNTYNSGRVDTSQVMLTEDATNQLVNQMLQSNQGLATVASGQKAVGGYDSTATSLLTGNLLAQVAGEVAVRGAKTVNTIGSSSSSTYNSGYDTVQNIGATNSFNNSTTTQNIGASTSSTSSTGTTATDSQSVEDMTGVSLTDKSGKDNTTKEESKGGWIVCTELVRQNRMPHRFYIYGLQAFSNYDAKGKKGYYIWAVPAVKHLRENPNSLLSKALEIVMVARAEYLAAEAGCKKAEKKLSGFLAKHILYGVCWTLSRTIARDYNKITADEVAYAGR